MPCSVRAVLLALIAVVVLSRAVVAAPARVYQMDAAGAVAMGGLQVRMTREQARGVLGAPDKERGQSYYYDQEKKHVSMAVFKDDRILQIFGSQVEVRGKPARTREQMEKLVGPPSAQPDANSAYWYIEAPSARLIVVFSSEDGKPYCSLIDRSGKDF